MKTNKKTNVSILFLFTIFALTFFANAQTPSDLDPDFFGGRVLRRVLNSAPSESAWATAIQPDGKIVVVGEMSSAVSDTNRNFFVMRYTADGVPDNTFGGLNGWTAVDLGATSNDFARAVAIAPDGKIVVAGRACDTTSGCRIVVARITSAGFLDGGFSGDGVAIANVGTVSSGYTMAVQSDGKIVVGGDAGGAFGNDTGIQVLVRFTTTGVLDSTFDGDGIVTTDFYPTFQSSAQANAVAIQSDGKIVTAGRAASPLGNNGAGSFALARYNSNGSLDTTFDGDGRVITDTATSTDYANAIALKSDGKIVAVGDTNPTTSDYEVAIAQYNSNGTLDASFGGSGFIIVPIGTAGSQDYGHAVAAQTDGKIIVGGSFNNSSNRFVARFNSNGTLDNSFDSDGINTTIAFRQPDGAADLRGIVVQNDGKAVVVGSSDSSIAVARLKTNGTLDGTFGNRVISYTPDYSMIRSIASQTDGKIVVAGYYALNTANPDFRVARYTPEGLLDISFGSGGFQTIGFGNTPGGTPRDDRAEAVKIQSDGKIVVAGYSGVDTFCEVTRLNTNGTLDTTFSGDGLVRTSGTCLAMAIQSDGKIVLSGLSILIRYNTDGSLDTTFDGDGIVNNLSSDGLAVAIQSDGKIVAAGRGGSGSSLVVSRRNPNGTIDSGFGTGGSVVTNIFNSNSIGETSLAIQPDGKIIAGFPTNVPLSTDGDFGLVRLNTNGTFDATFGNNGIVRTDFGSTGDFLSGLGIQSNGKIVAVGTSSSGFLPDFAMARYNTDGSLDTTFDLTANGFADNSLIGDGKITTDISGSNDVAYAMAIQPDDKIIAGGYSAVGAVNHFSLVRYRGTAVAPRRAPFDYDGDNKTDLSIFRPAPGEWWINRSSNGGNFAAQFGSTTDKIVPADYTGDGKTDFAFWRPSTGQWFILRSEDLSFFAFPFGASGDIPVPADYDGDGKADAAVFRPSTLTWFISKSTGGTDIITFGASGDKPVVADYDGDGKADIAIYRNNGGVSEWWIRRSSTGVVFAAQFGASTDKPVQGDYTGDGKVDIAVWRPSNGNWFILRSEDFSFFAFPFGANGDIPVAGDYDGDGKFDAAVFRPTNQTWFVQRSTAGTLIQAFGISGDLPTPNAFVP